MNLEEIDKIVHEYSDNMKKDNKFFFLQDMKDVFVKFNVSQNKDMVTIVQHSSSSENSSVLRTILINCKLNNYRVVGGIGKPTAEKIFYTLKEAIDYGLSNILN